MEFLVKLQTPEVLNFEVKINTYMGKSKFLGWLLGRFGTNEVQEELVEVLKNTRITLYKSSYTNGYNERITRPHMIFYYPECSRAVKEILDYEFEGAYGLGGGSWKKCWDPKTQRYRIISAYIIRDFRERGHNKFCTKYLCAGGKGLTGTLSFRFYLTKPMEEVLNSDVFEYTKEE